MIREEAASSRSQRADPLPSPPAFYAPLAEGAVADQRMMFRDIYISAATKFLASEQDRAADLASPLGAEEIRGPLLDADMNENAQTFLRDAQRY